MACWRAGRQLQQAQLPEASASVVGILIGVYPPARGQQEPRESQDRRPGPSQTRMAGAARRCVFGRCQRFRRSCQLRPSDPPGATSSPDESAHRRSHAGPDREHVAPLANLSPRRPARDARRSGLLGPAVSSCETLEVARHLAATEGLAPARTGSRTSLRGCPRCRASSETPSSRRCCRAGLSGSRPRLLGSLQSRAKHPPCLA